MEQGQGGQGKWEKNFNLQTNKTLSQGHNSNENRNLKPENWYNFLFLFCIYEFKRIRNDKTVNIT